jgi:hypothetical protein
MAEISLEDFKTYLPSHLSAEGKEELFKRLKDFPLDRQFYTQHPDVLAVDSPMQGDGWRGFVAIEFHTLARKIVSGIVLSNSCDVDPTNARDLPVRVLFAPLISIAKYIELLSGQAGRSQDDIQNILASVRQQKTTSIFYLPPLPGNDEELMILLDDVHSHPLADFLQTERSRLFRLNMYGFYLFAFKLSLHLMRLHEGIDRH